VRTRGAPTHRWAPRSGRADVLHCRPWWRFSSLSANRVDFRRLKAWARVILRDVHALYLASRDPRVPWYAKAMAAVVAGYALSPIDLIPDFIPVLGYLDEVILLPLCLVLVIRLIPPEVMAEHRGLAAAAQQRPVSRGAVW
jgi:uncharacterized membrane protein YkvA (DUF1232 family)